MTLYMSAFENTYSRKCNAIINIWYWMQLIMKLDGSLELTAEREQKLLVKTSIHIFSDCETLPWGEVKLSSQLLIQLTVLLTTVTGPWGLSLAQDAWFLCCFSSTDCNQVEASSCRSLWLGALCPVGGIRAGEQRRESHPLLPSLTLL